MNDSEATAGSQPCSIPGLRVLREIGSGLRGTVYAASDGRRTLALKVYRRGVSLDHSVVERLLKNADNAIRHPNLLPLESVGETSDNCVYVTMPLLHGDSLETLMGDLRRGASEQPSLSPLAVGPDGATHPHFHQRATEILKQTAEGLALAHREGIVHRHLGPRNLLMTPGGRLTITDFGSDSSGEGGGPALVYRAPEQLEAFPEDIPPSADVYALGALLYELVTRRPPFTAANPKELKRAISRCRVVPPRSIEPDVPADLEACILKALEREPGRRYADAGELAEDLGRFLRGEPTRATAPRARPRLLPRDGADRTLAGTEYAEAPSSFGFRRLFQHRLARRVGLAVLLGAALLVAALSGNRMRQDSQTRAQSEATVSLVENGDYSTAIEESEKFASLNPGSGGSRLLSDYARNAAALSSLQKATSALGEAQLRDAVSAAEEAARYRPDDSELTTLVERLRVRSEEDPVARDLADPSSSVQTAALRRLAHEISSGRRPRDDARLAARVIRASDSGIVRSAIETLALLETGSEILEAFGLAEGHPDISIAGDTLDLLCGILEEKLDQETAELFCRWSFDSCEVLDAAPRPISLHLPPNLEIDVEAECPRGFRARWIRVMARHDSALLLESLPKIAGEDQLAGSLVAALSSVGTPEARDALAGLARSQYLRGGYAALSALADMGAYCSLLEVAQGDLPVPYREMALTFLGEDYGYFCIGELRSLALRSPEAAIRRLSFHYLSRETEPLATGAIPGALGDPELRQAAYAWLGRLPQESVLGLLPELLVHPDVSVRLRASSYLAGRKAGGDTFASLVRCAAADVTIRRDPESRGSSGDTGPGTPCSWLALPVWLAGRSPAAFGSLESACELLPKPLRDGVHKTVAQEAEAITRAWHLVAFAGRPPGD